VGSLGKSKPGAKPAQGITKTHCLENFDLLGFVNSEIAYCCIYLRRWSPLAKRSNSNKDSGYLLTQTVRAALAADRAKNV
jgi:hypothetical protein